MSLSVAEMVCTGDRWPEWEEIRLHRPRSFLCCASESDHSLFWCSFSTNLCHIRGSLHLHPTKAHRSTPAPTHNLHQYPLAPSCSPAESLDNVASNHSPILSCTFPLPLLSIPAYIGSVTTFLLWISLRTMNSNQLPQILSHESQSASPFL